MFSWVLTLELTNEDGDQFKFKTLDNGAAKFKDAMKHQESKGKESGER